MKLCEECCSRPANIHLMQTVGAEQRSMFLCEECARKHGISISIEMEGHGREGDTSSVAMEAGIEPADDECPSCRMKLSEFVEKGWLGCSVCYDAFEQKVESQQRQFDSVSQHTGKKYRRTDSVENTACDIAQLRSELNIAVKNEEFERAAFLRDAIRDRNEVECA